MLIPVLHFYIRLHIYNISIILIPVLHLNGLFLAVCFVLFFLRIPKYFCVPDCIGFTFPFEGKYAFILLCTCYMNSVSTGNLLT